MALLPTFTWEQVTAGEYFWCVGTIPPSVTLPHATVPVRFVLGTTGAAVNTFTGDILEGSNVIENVSSSAGLGPFQPLSHPLLQHGSMIAGVDQGPPITVLMYTNMHALGTEAGASITASDPFPLGSLAVNVSPANGTTITDYCFDDTGNPGNEGDGQLILNYSGQAEAYFTVAFAEPGTFEVSVNFSSADTNYADATSSPITVVVT
jgi:hypothetical protein